MDIVATLNEGVFDNAKNLADKKRVVNSTLVIGLSDDQQMHEVVTVRWYMARSRDSLRVYCSIWVRPTGDRHRSGHGWVDGGGYHKESAALQEALESAGITLSSDIDGRGDGAMRDALEAVAVALGYPLNRIKIING